MVDCLPGPDADYQAWVMNFVNYSEANLIALGLAAGDMTPVTTAQTAFNGFRPSHCRQGRGDPAAGASAPSVAARE